MADKKKPKNLEELFEQVRKERSDDLDKSFNYYDKHTKKENQNYLFNNIFNPAQDKMYQTLKKGLDEAFKDDEAKVHGKSADMKKVVAKGLKDYFQSVDPGVAKAVEGMSEDEAYEHLVHHYDAHIGAGKDVPSIRALAESYTKDKDATVGDIKRALSGLRETHAQAAVDNLNEHVINTHLASYRPIEIASYLKPKLEKAGIEIQDKVVFSKLGIAELIGVYTGLEKGEWGKGGYRQYGLKKKKESKSSAEDYSYSDKKAA